MELNWNEPNELQCMQDLSSAQETDHISKNVQRGQITDTKNFIV